MPIYEADVHAELNFVVRTKASSKDKALANIKDGQFEIIDGPAGFTGSATGLDLADAAEIQFNEKDNKKRFREVSGEPSRYSEFPFWCDNMVEASIIPPESDIAGGESGTAKLREEAQTSSERLKFNFWLRF